MKFVSDKIVARNELGVKKGQLTYLKNLAKVIYSFLQSSKSSWYFFILCVFFEQEQSCMPTKHVVFMCHVQQVVTR